MLSYSNRKKVKCLIQVAIILNMVLTIDVYYLWIVAYVLCTIYGIKMISSQLSFLFFWALINFYVFVVCQIL